MLLNLGHPSELADARGKWGYILALFVGLALLAEVMALNRSNTIDRMIPPDLAAKAAAAAATPLAGGIIGPVAAPLFKEYLLAFELTSVLLLAAIVGSVVLGKRRTDAR
jgi:NADH-quinone oxidoreductase subunit J